jgi:hypothetical protein
MVIFNTEIPTSFELRKLASLDLREEQMSAETGIWRLEFASSIYYRVSASSKNILEFRDVWHMYLKYLLENHPPRCEKCIFSTPLCIYIE